MDRRGAVDVAPVAVLTVVAVVELLTNPDIDAPPAVAAGMALAQTLPLLVRRRWPLGVLLVTCALTGVFGAAYGVIDKTASPFVALLLAVYASGAYAGRGRARWSAAALAAYLAAVTLVEREAVSDLLFIGSILYAVFSAATVVRSRQDLVTALAARTVELEHERAAAAGLAIAEERRRIARELHDVVAHGLSVMVLQAGAERRDLQDERPQSAATLATIEQTGRASLAEMRRLLGILRGPDEAHTLAPPPSLSLLDDLVAHARAAGLTVDLRVHGDLSGLPAGLDMSAYRIVQEALTNTLRHAAASTVTIDVRRHRDDLHLEVVDDGRTSTEVTDGAERSGGHGLIGMRERATLFGGELAAGPVRGGGWAVRARLPLPRDTS